MCGERFDAERFGRVVPAEHKIHPELFGGNCGPMRRFAGDEGIDLPAGALAKAGAKAGAESRRKAIQVFMRSPTWLLTITKLTA
jgi:hypothetical protein